MSTETVILLARHGLTAWNDENRTQGWSDNPLNADGFDQVRQLARSVSTLGSWDLIVSSDLLRSRKEAPAFGPISFVPLYVPLSSKKLDELLNGWQYTADANV